MNDTTIIIKAHERHKQLRALVKSIRTHWADVPIIVSDDSGPASQRLIRRICQDFDARHLATEFDVGISRGRNLAVDQVATDSFILMEDDFLIPEGGARLAKLVRNLDEHQVHICGGELIQLNRGGRSRMVYAGKITAKKREGGGIHIHHEHSKRQNGCERVDIVLNFFAAKTAVIKEHRWDDQLKLCEHFDFFYRAMLKGLTVMIDHDVVIYHDHATKRSPLYCRQRNRARPQFSPIAMAKHNITMWTDHRQRLKYD